MLGQIAAVCSVLLFLWALVGSLQALFRQSGMVQMIVPAHRATRQDDLRILAWVLGTSVAVYAVGMLTVVLNGQGGSFAQTFEQAFFKADALHYMNIAENGYTAVGESRYFIVFFPLFPWLTRAFSVLTLGNMVLAACLLNTILLALACMVMFRIGILDFDRASVHRAVQYLLVFPVAFFWHNPYSESLFFFLSALSIYYARTHRWWQAGLAGFLCALTRATGVLCAVPLVLEAFYVAKQSGRLRFGQWVKMGAWSALAPLGTVCYLVLNYVVTGNAFMFLIHQKEHWSNGFQLFPHAVDTVVERMVTNQTPTHAVLWISQSLAIFFFLFLMVMGVKRLRPSMNLYNCAYFLMMISSSWLLSGPRYLMAMFPAFYVLGAITHDRLRHGVTLGLLSAGLVVMTLCFAAGHAIY